MADPLAHQVACTTLSRFVSRCENRRDYARITKELFDSVPVLEVMSEDDFIDYSNFTNECTAAALDADNPEYHLPYARGPVRWYEELQLDDFVKGFTDESGFRVITGIDTLSGLVDNLAAFESMRFITLG